MIQGDVYLLDDGFQHLQLARDLDIVIDVPATRFSREGRAALRDADILIPRRIRPAGLEPLRGKRVFAFSGLADNGQFFAMLREHGIDLTGTSSFPDHHRYSGADLVQIRSAAADAEVIVTTEKDAVKLRASDIVAVPIEFEIEPEVLERITAVASGTTTPPAGRGREGDDNGARRAEAGRMGRSGERGMKKRRKHPLLQRVEYAAYRSAAAAIRRASDESLTRWGSRLGTLSRRLLPRRDRLAMRNLQAAFPEKGAADLRRTLDECWRHFGREMLGFIRAQSYSLAEIADRCPFVHAEVLNEARARGRGVLLISAHFGGWEIAGLAVMALVDDVRTVARPLDNELLERDLVKSRARTGAEVVDRRRAARTLMKGLSENAVIVLLPDQAVLPREGILAPFLGRPAWTTDAPAKMALRFGSTIVFGFCIPDGSRHLLEFESPIRVDELSDAERNPEALTGRINDVISRRIAARPELWLWMHDRWKGTGEGEAADGE